jgi:hypothetical protein
MTVPVTSPNPMRITWPNSTPPAGCRRRSDAQDVYREAVNRQVTAVAEVDDGVEGGAVFPAQELHSS